MPQGIPRNRRQPFEAVGFCAIIAMSMQANWIYRQDKAGGIHPPSKRVELRDVVDFELSDPLSLDFPERGIEVGGKDGHIAIGHPIASSPALHLSPHKPRGINRYSCSFDCRRESHLDRVKLNVAALHDEEGGEKDREDREKRESHAHSIFKVRYMRGIVKEAM